MADPTLPTPVDPRASRRSKLVIASAAAALAVGTFALSSFTGHVAKLHEQRVLAGDYSHVHMESGAVKINGKGEVQPPGDLVHVSPRYVASLKLVPPGDYQAILVAHDGKGKKSELVIGAQDAQGAWHPPSAEEILDRLEVPRPGEPQ